MWPFSKKQNPSIEQKSLANPEDWLREIFGAVPTVAGIAPPSTRLAMQCPPFRRGVAAIAEPIGSLTPHVYRRDGEARVRDTSHPVAKLLRDPNPWMSASDFREQLQRDCLLHGNGLAVITRVDGEPREMLRLDPTTIKIEADDFGAPVYKVQSGEQREIPRGDIFHIKAASLDGVKGQSPAVECWQAIAVALLLEKHAAALFGRSAKPGGVVEVPQDVPEKGYKEMMAAWKVSGDGPENIGKTQFLVNGATFKQLTMSSTDAQFLELRRYAVDEIARALSVPPSMLYELGRATWGNSENQSASFLTFSLMRWIKAWQNEIRLKLFKPEERDDYFAEFNTDDLLTVDFAARATAYGQYRSMGAMTGNEVRKGLNLPPLPEGNSLSNPHITTPAAANDNSKDITNAA